MKKIVFIVLNLFIGVLSAQNSDLFERGNTLYNEGKFSEAIALYEEVLADNLHSAELYFNLGNAHYKLNNIAPSIYYFEKALQLKPDDAEIKNNAAFARNMTIDAIDTVPEVGFSRLFKNFANIMSSDRWAMLAIVGVFIFVILFLTYRFAYASSRKRAAFIISTLALAISGISLIMAFQKTGLETKNRPAIVFAQESQVKAEPNLRSEEAFRLHEGTKVQVLDTLKDWKKIKLSDGSTGWILSDDIKLLKPF